MSNFPLLRCESSHRIRRYLVFVAFVCLLGPIAAFSQPFPSLSPELQGIVEDVLDGRSQRMRDVAFYVEMFKGLELPGMADAMASTGGGACVSNCVVHQVEEITGADGSQFWADRIMSMLEVQTMLGLAVGPEIAAGFGVGLIATQLVVNEQMPMVPSLPDAWMDPHRMFFEGGMMMLDGAQAMLDAQESLANSNATTQAEADRLNQLTVQIEDLGVENTPAGPRRRLGTSGLDELMDNVDGHETYLNGFSFVIDEEESVIVGHRFDGTMVGDGESRPFFIEIENSDFRQVPGCDLYEPYRRTVRMGGMLDDAQLAEMEEARQQLEEFEAQLAAMPPAQRAMMEGMIGSQMDTVRSMADGGAIEHVQETEQILCDPDLRALFSSVDPAFQLAEIQRDLVTLGFMPGNTDGVMDTLTEIAISQYQAERGVPVTGQPSADLGFMLANEAAGAG